MTADDIEKLVDDTAMQVSEDLSILVPDGSKTDVTVAKAKPYRGRPYSDNLISVRLRSPAPSLYCSPAETRPLWPLPRSKWAF
jgi:hypothetical protein